MYKIVKKSRAIQCIILLIMLVAMITIFPVRMWEETIPSVSNQKVAGATDGIIGDDYLLQRFIAQYDHLGTIHIYLADFVNGWDKDKEVNSFIFRLMDSDMEIMFEELVDVRFVDKPGFCPIYVNESMEVGKDYYIFLQGKDGSRAWFGLEETAGAGSEYVSRLVYNYDEVQGYNIIAEYNYTVPLRKQKIAMAYAALLAVSLLLVAVVELIYRKFRKDSLITVEKAFRTTANIAVVLGAAVSITAIGPFRMFDFRWTDNLFYIAGVVLLSAVLLFAINRKKDKADYTPLAEMAKSRGAHWLQAVFIAGAVAACCSYMNGLYDVHHTIAERKFIAFFALILISMSAGKDIWNRISATYAVVAGVLAVWFYQTNLAVVEDGALGITAFKNGIVAAYICGFALLLLIRLMIRKTKKTRVCVWYTSILVLFFALAVILRNGRSWILTMAVVFLIFYLRYAMWDKKEYLLQNICNGIALHFIFAMIFSFMQRPFLSWIYPRFPFIFHTVTITAVYLMIVFCAALLLLAEKMGKSHKLGDLWKELILVGASGTYLLFTASRTGFLSVAVILVLVAVCAARGRGKEKIFSALRFLGIMAGAVIWCFPIVFTAQRIVPAVNNQVYRHEVETFPDAITRGNEWNSMYYINVERFFEVFNNKIFGIPEKGSSSYERSQEYQEYRAKRFNNKGEVVWDGNIDELYQENAGPSGETEGKVPGEGLNIIGNKSDEERAADSQAAQDLKEEALNATPEEVTEEEAPEEDMSVYEATQEYANGRFDIYLAYLEQLNLFGHEEMGAVLPDGSVATHAHNIYLQVAYDHGIIVGIVFLIVGAATFIQGLFYYRRNRNTVKCACFPMVYTAGFAVAGMVEWIFHLCNPAGFMLLLVMAPLLFEMNGIKDKVNEKGK